jgi:chromosome segregation ATPase|tara:strand:- start:70 stop:339 length:270 start_codon:yes stop_codon:yes gene_type:complete
MINEKGPNDLEAQIEYWKKKAQEAELETSLVKAVGVNSPEMKALQKQKEFLQEKCRQAGARIKELENDNKRLANEVNDYIDRITKNNVC